MGSVKEQAPPLALWDDVWVWLWEVWLGLGRRNACAGLSYT